MQCDGHVAFVGNTKGRDNLGDVIIDQRLMLKLILDVKK
jgi:hypothetical protein